jgi:hypothetical protein
MDADAEKSIVDLGDIVHSNNSKNQNNQATDSAFLRLVMKQLNSNDPQQILNTIVQVIVFFRLY